MTYPLPLLAGTLLTNAAVTLYTCPANQRAVLTTVSVCNTDDANAITFTLYKVPSGGSSAQDRYMKVNEQTLASQQSARVPVLQSVMMNPGDYIEGLASTTSKISIAIDGLLFPVNGGN